MRVSWPEKLRVALRMVRSIVYYKSKNRSRRNVLVCAVSRLDDLSELPLEDILKIDLGIQNKSAIIMLQTSIMAFIVSHKKVIL